MKKGFTLIELLIVIGILAILATTVVLVLNPAGILKETRDTQRISDLDTLRSAIGLYLASVSSPDLSFVGVCRDAGVSDNYWATIAGVTNPFAAPAVGETITQHANVGRVTEGNGWVPINLGSIPGGQSPLAILPIDPSNIAGNLATHPAVAWAYAYTCSGSTFEINANMESDKHDSPTPCPATNPGAECTDGGSQDTIYEVGTSLTL